MCKGPEAGRSLGHCRSDRVFVAGEQLVKKSAQDLATGRFLVGPSMALKALLALWFCPKTHGKSSEFSWWRGR